MLLHVLRKISELLKKFHSQKVVRDISSNSCVKDERTRRDFDLTALPCLYFRHCMVIMSFLCVMNPIAINLCEMVVVCLKWGSRFIFPYTDMSQLLQEHSLLCKGVEKHLLISTEKAPIFPQNSMGNTVMVL